jgi:hypothetical protein
MAINAVQLRAVMRFHLKHFNTTDNKVTNNTIHNEILSDDDGVGSSNSKNLYKAAVRWSLANNGDNDLPWPTSWMDKSVKELADTLIND